MKRHPVMTEGGGRVVCACATGSCALSALVGLFTGSAPWGALYDVRVYHCLALVIYPFYFHI
jgi:hypothetical protein